MEDKRKETIDKWQKAGMLSGIQAENLKTLMDNQENHLLKEGSDDDSDDSNSFGFPLLPIAQKVAAKTIGQDLVSVNPLGTEPEEEKIKRMKKIREDKIDAVIEGKEFEETEEHKSKYGPRGEIYYVDYKYKDDEESDGDTKD